MDVREIKTKNLVIGAIIGMVLMFAIWIASGILQNYAERAEGIIDDGVTAIYNGTPIGSISLSDHEFSVKKGDVLDIIIPYDEKLEGGKTALILLYLCGVEAYAGEDLIYTYGLDRVESGKMVGSGYHFIKLPTVMEGKDLRIKIYVNENNAFTSINEIYYVDSDEAYIFFAGRSMVGLFVGSFLAALGFIMVLAGLLATCFNRYFGRIPLIGAFSMAMGLWTFSGQKTFQLFVKEYELWSLLEYVLLYLAPVALLAIVYSMRRHNNDWKKWTLLADLIFYSVFVFACLVLHALNIEHICNTLVYFHAQGAIVLVVAVVIGVFMVRNKTRADMLFQMAIFVLCGGIAVDLLRFNIQKFLLPNLFILNNSILPVATLIFILILILSYIIHLYDMLMTKNEKEMLTQLAYHDVLTGLYNRAKATERFIELNAGDEEYCIISLDVNGLKYVNDNYGHEAGDELIKNFGHNLHEAFRGVGKTYRMGGDEFMVIVREKAFEDIDRAIIKLKELQKPEAAKVGTDFNASYGMAYRSETDDGTAEKVYFVADERMYEMKMTAHNSRAALERKQAEASNAGK